MTEEDIENIYWELISQDGYDDRTVFIYGSVGFPYKIKKHFVVMLDCKGAVTAKIVRYEYGSEMYDTKRELLTALNKVQLGLDSVTWELAYTTSLYWVYSARNVPGLVKGHSRWDGSVTYGYHGKRVKTEVELLKIINNG